jgi:phenylalanyl-tRNA synthetase beta chain
MNTSLAWLNQYLRKPVTAERVDSTLTSVGFPIEERHEVTTTAGAGDTALDVEITANRPDCLCHLGLARELAAADDIPLGPPACDPPSGTAQPVQQATGVDLQEPELCPVYTARVIRDVRVGPSPQWLAARLEAIGLRPINNVVDVTNYVLFELGQPLHAFDLRTLNQQRIVVRRAEAEEPFRAIDGNQHKLDNDMLVIADGERPVAVAGVMGGAETEVSEATADILLESARFDPLSVRRTSRRLKLASDSSYRFERGVDPAGVELASCRAVELILQTAGGELAEGVIRRGEEEPAPHTVTMGDSRCRSLLGIDIPADQQAGYLDRLGLSPHVAAGTLTCRVPSRRKDLQREVDLIEEVARMHGLDRVPVQEKIHIVARPPQAAALARQAANRTLAAHGYHEAITFSFVAPKQARPFLPEGTEPVEVEQQRVAQSALRPALAPSLLICRKANQDRGNRDVRLFECATSCYWHDGRIEEREQLALLADAEQSQEAVRALRGTIEELIERLGGQPQRQAMTIEPVEDARFQAGGRLLLEGGSIGRFGLISQRLQDQFDLQTPVVLAELDWPALQDLYPPQVAVGELPRFPGIERDLSIVVDESVPWRQVEATVRQPAPAMLEAVTFLDTYRGKPIPKGQKSVSLRLRFRDPERTLRHEEVDPQVNAVIEALKQSVGAALRG